MNGSHIHLKVQDLPAALAWFEQVWQLPFHHFPEAGMATAPFGTVSIVLETGDEDSPATLAFLSDDCAADYHAAVERGAEPIEKPKDRPYGVRNAYLQGPGALTLEIEQEI